MKMIDKIGVLVFFAVSINFLSQPASALTNIDSCQNLNITNEVYNLTANVSSANYCFHIIANNIILDSNGYQINYSQVSHATLSTTYGNDGYGIYLYSYGSNTSGNLEV